MQLIVSIRQNVEKVLVLSNNGEVNEIKNIKEINTSDRRALLGSIPAILSADCVLITEGTSASFDTIFYKWILENNRIEIVPMGGCHDVAAVSNRTGIWEAIASSILIKGVIDKDFRSDESIKN